MIILLLILICIRAQENPLVSDRSCTELSSIFSNPQQQGAENVCGASLIRFIADRGACANVSTWAQALRLCTSIGARLCTAQELANDEALGSGCELDNRRVWSASKAGCPPSMAASQAGAGIFLDQIPIQCTSEITQLDVRCCADEYVVPCQKDECSTLRSPENKCIREGPNFTCSCGAREWITGFLQQSCIMPPNPCLSMNDPCNSKRSPMNRCLRNGSSYQCVCTDGFSAGSVGDTCVPCLDPCEGDPCRARGHPRNICTVTVRESVGKGLVTGCLQHSCTCQSPGFSPGRAKQTCMPCGNICERDECSTSLDPRNRCVLQLPFADGVCGTYTCVCSRSTFTPTISSQSCTACSDPCRGDPCNVNANALNKCEPTQGIKDVPGACFTDYTCTCIGENWLAPASLHTCLYCENPCTSQDRCNTRQFPQNICQMALGPDDSEDACPSAWICSCAPGLLSPPDQSTCLRCSDSCVGDPCNRTAFPVNTCTLTYLPGDDRRVCPTSHVCGCEGVGITLSADKQSCVPCINPCSRDPCRAASGSRNVCTVRSDPSSRCATEWTCRCEEPGFGISSDLRSCIRCANPCDGQCNQVFNGTRTSNTCTASELRAPPLVCRSGFVCQCPRYPWVLSSDAAACILCRDPCSSNPCSSTESPTNVCTRIPAAPGICPTQHTCSCGTYPWVATPNNISCLRCADLCQDDPCSSQGAPGNICIPKLAITDSNRCPTQFECQCLAQGYGVATPPTRCIKCAPPCAKDPCGSLLEPRNRCIRNNYTLPGRCTAHSCACDFPAYGNFASTCRRCPDPCADDPCQASENPENQCNLARAPTDEPGACPTAFVCSCSGFGWVVPQDQQSCVYCVDVCERDPCSNGANSRNTCKPLITNDVFSLCPTDFECSCRGIGWVPAANGRSCYQCSAPCAGDPCDRLGGPSNMCVPLIPPIGSKTCPDYVCNCLAEGYQTRNDSKGCDLCPDICGEDDPCRHDESALNVCSITYSAAGRCGTATCSCNAVGYYALNGSVGCRRCTEPCSLDPCRTTANPDNTCVPGAALAVSARQTLCRAYTCRCVPNQWLAPLPGAQTCIPCSDPCDESNLNRPCGDDPANRCSAARSGFALTPSSSFTACYSYQCDCSASGWVTPADKLTCSRCPDPCDHDACAESYDDLNVCVVRTNGIRPNTCPGYTCACSGSGWYAPAGRQSCLPCDDPCQVDPCSRGLDGRNICVPISVASIRRQAETATDEKCASFVCQCAPGWISGASGRSCVPCPDPCQAGTDPCRSSADNRNVCRYNSLLGAPESAARIEGCGGYTCDCRAPGWTHAIGNETCVPCPNPCDNDPCLSAITTNNICTPDVAPGGIVIRRQAGATSCEGYTCACTGANWYAPDRLQSCRTCPNPCSNDPCFSSLEPKNICRPQKLPPLKYPSSNFTEKCPTYRCECGGSAWLLGADARSCEPCPNPCDKHDPCNGAADVQNICIPQKITPIIPLSYNRSAFANRRLLQLSTPFLVPPAPLYVSADVSAAYKTLLATCGGYSCRCNGLGWLDVPGRQSCAPCPNPCSGDPCKNNVDSRNTCTPDLDLYSLRRQAPATTRDRCGGYMCSCADTGWLTAADQQSCIPCPNPCYAGDPCSRNSDASNICTPETLVPDSFPGRRLLQSGVCGGYSCACGLGWITSGDKQSCTRCPNPCQGIDPCNNRDDARNVCVPQYARTPSRRQALFLGGGTFDDDANFIQCGGYTCQCKGAGWVVSIDSQSCDACPNPCLGQDPCGVTGDARNFCTPNYEAVSVTVNNPPNIRRQAGPVRLPTTRPIQPASLFQPLTTTTAFPATFPTTILPAVAFPSTLPTTFVSATPIISSNSLLTSNAFTATAFPASLATPNLSPLGRCGVYRCECSAPGWMALTNNQGCVPCPDPCSNRDDPCRLQQGINNKCIRTSNPVSVSQTDPLQKCGSYTCDCGAGYVQSANGKRCDPCPNPCVGRDPCAASQNPQNKCIPDNIGQYSGQYDLAVNDPTITVAGLRRQSPAYYFQGGSCGGYYCVCAGPVAGWISPSERLSCIRCTSPCELTDSCATQVDSRNICKQTATPPYGVTNNINSGGCGGYVCQCGAPGYVATAGGQACRICPNPCSSRDPCNTKADNANTCTVSYSGSNQAALNLLLALGNPLAALSTATNNPGGGCGQALCSCRGEGWKAGSGSRICIAAAVIPRTCTDPCLKDPCNSKLNSGNRCINQAQVECGYYECTCASADGWVSSQPVQTAGPTCQQVDVAARSKIANALGSSSPLAGLLQQALLKPGTSTSSSSTAKPPIVTSRGQRLRPVPRENIIVPSDGTATSDDYDYDVRAQAVAALQLLQEQRDSPTPRVQPRALPPQPQTFSTSTYTG